MEQFGFSSRTIKEIHKALRGPRGVPGEFRRVQNNLANKISGKSEPEVIYTPPRVPLLNGLIGNWENFVHNDSNFFPLVKTAIAHYQFEAIHPFEDGNGRTGRILMVLQMMWEKLLDFPVLFISGYLDKYSEDYKKLLLNISKKGQWWEFVEFMLEGYSVQALATQKSLTKLKVAKKELKHALYNEDNLGISRSNIENVINHIFCHPITHPKHMGLNTPIHWQTCSKYLAALSNAGLLKYEKSGRYNFYTNLKALESLAQN